MSDRAGVRLLFWFVLWNGHNRSLHLGGCVIIFSALYEGGGTSRTPSPTIIKCVPGNPAEAGDQ